MKIYRIKLNELKKLVLCEDIDKSIIEKLESLTNDEFDDLLVFMKKQKETRKEYSNEPTEEFARKIADEYGKQTNSKIVKSRRRGWQTPDTRKDGWIIFFEVGRSGQMHSKPIVKIWCFDTYADKKVTESALDIVKNILSEYGGGDSIEKITSNSYSGIRIYLK
jgi:hypothetical protein